MFNLGVPMSTGKHENLQPFTVGVSLALRRIIDESRELAIAGKRDARLWKKRYAGKDWELISSPSILSRWLNVFAANSSRNVSESSPGRFSRAANTSRSYVTSVAKLGDNTGWRTFLLRNKTDLKDYTLVFDYAVLDYVSAYRSETLELGDQLQLPELRGRIIRLNVGPVGINDFAAASTEEQQQAAFERGFQLPESDLSVATLSSLESIRQMRLAALNHETLRSLSSALRNRITKNAAIPMQTTAYAQPGENEGWVRFHYETFIPKVTRIMALTELNGRNVYEPCDELAVAGSFFDAVESEEGDVRT